MFEIDRQKFGVFVAELRKEKGLTQKELAQRLMISDKAISKWETGNSIPDVTLLVPLAAELGVSVTELLECRRMEYTENMDTAQTDVLLKKVIELSEEEREQKKVKNKKIYLLSAFIALVELFAVFLLSTNRILFGIENIMPIMIVSPLSIGFGAYFWLMMKEKLPSYYDENKIGVYVDGILHMNMPGVYYNNNNWPYIVKTLRAWAVAGMIGFPILIVVLSTFLVKGGLFVNVGIVLAFVLGGLFVPVYVVARKYEYGDMPRQKTSITKRDGKKIIGVIFIAAGIFAISYLFHGSATIGSSNRMMFVSSEGRTYWSATYQYFDGYQQRNLWMDEDDSLEVKVITEQGDLYIRIADENGNILLERENVGTENFSLSVSGRVTIRVEANKHKGSFSFD
ncbi:MAG: helix-turn-helix transcriptional regulator [Agathobacter sp.]|nr:helix-turn-helix transcriptional regulator [Agathobacter sp.]MBQ6812177.1 helix-turn-helix transcriptional regulator [Agathobacter sp.]